MNETQNWFKRIDRCKILQSRERSAAWNKYRDFIQKNKTTSKKKKYYFVNYGKYITDIMRATTYPRGSEIMVIPKKGYKTKEDMSQILYHVLNYIPDQIQLKFQDKLAITNACVYGTGLYKMGWYSKKVKSISDAGYSDQSNFWCKSVNPENIFIDWECDQDIDNARFIIHYEDRPVGWVSKYYKVAKSKISHTTYRLFDEDKKEEESSDPENQMTTVYEVYDKEKDEFKVFCEGYKDEPLDKFSNPYDICIYGALKFNEPIKGFWGIPPFLYLEPQMEENWEIINDMSEERKTGKRKIFVNGQILEEAKGAMKALKSKVSDAVVICKENPGGGQVYIANPQSNIFVDREDYLLRQNEMKEMAGVSPYKYSQLQRVRYSSEVDASREEGGLRDDEKIDIVYDFKNRQIGKMKHIVQKFATKDWVENIVGYGRLSDFQKKYITVDWKNETKIKGNYDVKLNFASIIPISSNQKKREIFDLLGVIVKVPPEQLPIDQNTLKMIWAYAISTFNIPEVEQIIEGAEDNIEVQTKVLRKLFAQIKDKMAEQPTEAPPEGEGEGQVPPEGEAPPPEPELPIEGGM